MTYEAFLEHCHRRGLNVEKLPSGIRIQCPVHGGSRASLSVRKGPDKIGLHCFAECDWHRIMDALELEPKDLWYDSGLYISEPPQPEGEWHYHDADRSYLFTVVKFRTPDGGKTFRQYVGENVVSDYTALKLVPYKLPDLIRSKSVYIVEGEKDADAVIKAGRFATTFPFGAGKFLPTYVRYFLGKRVTIVADKNEVGMKHAKTIYDSLEDIAIRRRVVEARSGADSYDTLQKHPIEEAFSVIV